MDRRRRFISHRLVQWNRSSMTLNGVMLLLLLALAFNLFAFALTLFTLSVHLFLALALDQFPFSRVAFAFLIDGLRRGVLHRLSDARQRVAGIM